MNTLTKLAALAALTFSAISFAAPSDNGRTDDFTGKRTNTVSFIDDSNRNALSVSKSGTGNMYTSIVTQGTYLGTGTKHGGGYIQLQIKFADDTIKGYVVSATKGLVYSTSSALAKDLLLAEGTILVRISGYRSVTFKLDTTGSRDLESSKLLIKSLSI